MKLSTKEQVILAIVIACWGSIFIGSGLIMNKQVKPIIETKYTLTVNKNKIPETQAKSYEIKLKEITIEVNNPISVDVKDYLENADKLDDKMLKALKLDTSLVNINQPGTYNYTITYNKKKYQSKIIVKEKELPNVAFTLVDTITIETGKYLSSNPRDYIKEKELITDEVYNNLTLDMSQVNTAVQGDYTYYIIYKGVSHQGTILVRDPGPKIITPNATCGDDATLENNKCVCKDANMEYNSIEKKCKTKEVQTQ